MQIVIGESITNGHPVMVDTKVAINGHLQLAGISGLGKTFQLTRLIKELVESASEQRKPIRIHMFDPHGDIDLPYSQVVKFSEATPYGYNPLELNPDPDFGGVRRSIQKFIAAMDKNKKLGTKQESVLRYLLEDLFASLGFKADDSDTWVPDSPGRVRSLMRGREGRVYLDVTHEQSGRFKELLRDPATGEYRGGWDSFDDVPEMRNSKCWWVEEDFYVGDLLMWEPKPLFKVAPNLDDAVRFTERKLKAHYFGTNSAAMSRLQDVTQAARVYHRRVADLSKRGEALSEVEANKLNEDLQKAREKAGQAFESYMASIQSGRELDDFIRYNSADVLQSVYERLVNERAKGIYNSVLPPFDANMPIWHYYIKPLEIPVQCMFVDMVCTRIFERAMQRGLNDDLVEVIVLDEGKRYVSDKPNDVLSRIAGEARKFGLGLWIASQSPEHFADDFIKATGTMIVLGLAEADTGVVARKLGIDKAQLNSITPQFSALVQVKNRGVLTSDFQLVKLPKAF